MSNPPGRPRTGDKRRDSTGRQNMGFQSPSNLRAMVIAAAKANDRSISAEIVSRLERTFYCERAKDTP